MDGLKEKSILILTHTLVRGAAQELEDYLIAKKVKTLLFIGNPLTYGYGRKTQETATEVKLYRRGILAHHRKSSDYKLPPLLKYVENMLRNIFYAFSSKEKFDLMIGVDNLNAFSCLILKLFGRGRVSVFYTIDYFRKGRFKSRIMDCLYFFMDKLCVVHSDIVWNVSPRMLEGREEKGLSSYFRGKQITVPIGISKDKDTRLGTSDRYRVIFLGNIAEESGAPLLLDSAREIIINVPLANFLFIGGGAFEDRAKKIVREQGLGGKVKFMGVVRERKNLEEVLSSGGIGLALYKPTDENHTYFADPTKPKDYLAMGIPLVITDVPLVAREISLKGAGILIKYDKAELIKALCLLLTDDQFYLKARDNALSLSNDYSWSNIFDNAFRRIDYE